MLMGNLGVEVDHPPQAGLGAASNGRGRCEAGVRAPRGTNPTNLCFAVERQADAKRKRDAMDQGQVAESQPGSETEWAVAL